MEAQVILPLLAAVVAVRVLVMTVANHPLGL
jgi:hypothetical protein